MKYIRLYEQFISEDQKSKLSDGSATFEDYILDQICAELRKQGHNKAYWGTENQESFVSIDGRDNKIYLWDSTEKDNKQVYTFFDWDDAHGPRADYVEDSHDIKEIIKLFRSQMVNKIANKKS